MSNNEFNIDAMRAELNELLEKEANKLKCTKLPDISQLFQDIKDIENSRLLKNIPTRKDTELTKNFLRYFLIIHEEYREAQLAVFKNEMAISTLDIIHEAISELNPGTEWQDYYKKLSKEVKVDVPRDIIDNYEEFIRNIQLTMLENCDNTFTFYKYFDTYISSLDDRLYHKKVFIEYTYEQALYKRMYASMTKHVKYQKAQ